MGIANQSRPSNARKLEARRVGAFSISSDSDSDKGDYESDDGIFGSTPNHSERRVLLRAKCDSTKNRRLREIFEVDK